MSVHNIYRDVMTGTDTYVGRAGRGFDGYFGNPFTLRPGDDRGATIERFREYAQDRMFRDPEYRERVRALHGRRLFCFCAPQACHGEVLLELAKAEHYAHAWSQDAPSDQHYIEAMEEAFMDQY